MVRITLATTLVLAATTAHAFTTTNTVGTRRHATSFVGTPLATPTFVSNTALHMNLFDRFQRVAKSNLNNVLKGLEDPEKIMEQALEDMQVRLVHLLSSAPYRLSARVGTICSMTRLISCRPTNLLLHVAFFNNNCNRKIWSRYANHTPKLRQRNVGFSNKRNKPMRWPRIGTSVHNWP